MGSSIIAHTEVRIKNTVLGRARDGERCGRLPMLLDEGDLGKDPVENPPGKEKVGMTHPWKDDGISQSGIGGSQTIMGSKEHMAIRRSIVQEITDDVVHLRRKPGCEVAGRLDEEDHRQSEGCPLRRERQGQTEIHDIAMTPVDLRGHGGTPGMSDDDEEVILKVLPRFLNSLGDDFRSLLHRWGIGAFREDPNIESAEVKELRQWHHRKARLGEAGDEVSHSSVAVVRIVIVEPVPDEVVEEPFGDIPTFMKHCGRECRGNRDDSAEHCGKLHDSPLS
jgi:hypothetical protein